MTVPEENRKIMRKLGRESHYSWDRPTRIPGRVLIQSYKGVKTVLDDKALYSITMKEPFEYLMGKQGGNFMLAGDSPFHAKQKETMRELLYRDQWHQHVKEFYEGITAKLLKEKSHKVGGKLGMHFTPTIDEPLH